MGVDKIETFGPPSPSSPPTKGRGKNFRKFCLVAAMLRCDLCGSVVNLDSPFQGALELFVEDLIINGDLPQKVS